MALNGTNTFSFLSCLKGLQTILHMVSAFSVFREALSYKDTDLGKCNLHFSTHKS